MSDKIFTTFDTHLYFSHASVVLNSSMKFKLFNSLLLCVSEYVGFMDLMEDCFAVCRPSYKFLVIQPKVCYRASCCLYPCVESILIVFLVAPDKQKNSTVKHVKLATF